jgi:hypothetical protein
VFSRVGRDRHHRRLDPPFDPAPQIPARREHRQLARVAHDRPHVGQQRRARDAAAGVRIRRGALHRRKRVRLEKVRQERLELRAGQ